MAIASCDCDCTLTTTAPRARGMHKQHAINNNRIGAPAAPPYT